MRAERNFGNSSNKRETAVEGINFESKELVEAGWNMKFRAASLPGRSKRDY